MKTSVGLVAAAVLLVVGLLLTPTVIFSEQRHAFAQRAIEAGWVGLAKALLRPLAAANDPRALNNLGAIYVNSVGPPSDISLAKRSFELAAASGLKRARLNLAMVRQGGCGVHIRAAALTALELEQLTKDADSATARLIQDCLYFSATGLVIADRSSRFIEADRRIAKTGDAEARLRSGWALLNVARTTRIPDRANDAEVGAYNREVSPIVRQAMEALFMAYDGGAAGANIPLNILSLQFRDIVGGGPLAQRLLAKQGWERWKEGAERGDWEAQCMVAEQQINELLGKKKYSRAEFDAAVKAGHACVNRNDVQVLETWHDGPVWLAYLPAQPLTRPSFGIGSTSAKLERLIFLDSDRPLQSGAATNREAGQ